MRVDDLFCGMGGTSLGFKQAGFTIDHGVDSNQTALDTYTKYIEAPGKLLDISTYYPGRGDYDAVIIGGTPCQDFSISNKKRNIYSKRSQLVLDFCRIVKAVQPEAFMFENVIHLSKWAEAALKEIPGYKVTRSLPNAADYGVAQSRRRKIFIGTKTRHVVLRPPVGEIRRTVRDAFNEVTDNWGYVKHRPETIEMFSRVHSTKWTKGEWKSDYQGIIRLDWNQPSGGIGNVKKFRILHPDEDRSITLAEALSLQGFPQWYIPTGTDTAKAQQIADAVPPRLAYHAARAIQAGLTGTRTLDTFS